jgi:hypothetical protein
MPSTRTTHLSRCLRTAGSPLTFHDMAILQQTLIHR